MLYYEDTLLTVQSQTQITFGAMFIFQFDLLSACSSLSKAIWFFKKISAIPLLYKDYLFFFLSNSKVVKYIYMYVLLYADSNTVT